MASAPALSRLLGLAGRRSFQFMDSEEEAQFRAIDFSESQRTDVGISVVQLIVVVVVRWLGYDSADMPLDATENFFLVPLLITIFVLQISVRMYLATEARAFGWLCFLTTFILWVVIIAAAHFSDFTIFQAAPIFPMLFFFCVICQVLIDRAAPFTPGLATTLSLTTTSCPECESLALS